MSGIRHPSGRPPEHFATGGPDRARRLGGLAVVVLLLCAFPARAETIAIAGRQQEPVRLVADSTAELVQRSLQFCMRFLGLRNYPYNGQIDSTLNLGAGPAWVLETDDRQPVARVLGIDTGFLEQAAADAYVLSVTRMAGHPLVSIVGRGEGGVRAGLARLAVLAADRDGRLLAPAGTVRAAPFFPLRRLHVCVTGRIAQGNEWCVRHGLPADRQYADTLWTNWDDYRLQNYAEQLWLLGFNSVELPELRGYRGVFSDRDLVWNVTPKLRVFMEALRQNGLQVSQFVWGQSLFEEGQNLCWNDPAERARMQAEFDRLAHTYGDLVDHVVVHVGDPGGCNRNGCDPYRTTQQIATYILEAYRRVNPKVTVTLSAWANAGFWNGAPGEPFLDTKYSPAEIGIALHRWYDAEPARRVREAGRPVDVWGWYLSDFELALDWSLLMRRLDTYFSALPDQAGRDVRAISTELNFSGWPHIVNAYVSAQKMWDPRRDLAEIEREYCAAVFGDANAEAMVAVHRACEAFVHPDRYYGFIPKDDCLPDLFGTPEYNRQLDAALAAARSVVLDETFVPRLTCATPPHELLGDLYRRLSLIGTFSHAAQQLADAGETTPEQRAQIVEEALARAEVFRRDPAYAALVARVKRN